MPCRCCEEQGRWYGGRRLGTYYAFKCHDFKCHMRRCVLMIGVRAHVCYESTPPGVALVPVLKFS